MLLDPRGKDDGVDVITGRSLIVHRYRGPLCFIGGIAQLDVVTWFHHLIIQRHPCYPVRIRNPCRDPHRIARTRFARLMLDLPNSGTDV